MKRFLTAEQNKVIEEASTIVRHYRIHRREGHTTSSILGVKSTPGILITHNQFFTNTLKNSFFPEDDGKVIPISAMESLEGKRPCPIVIDNDLLELTLIGLLKIIDLQIEEMREMRVSLDRICNISLGYRDKS